MKLFLGITTYQRPDYLLHLLHSFIATTLNSEHEWFVAVHNDELKELKLPFDYPVKVLYSDREGVHVGKNKLLRYAYEQGFDYGFICDDDIHFMQDGWDSLYLDAIQQSGYRHLVYYNRWWRKERHKPKVQGTLQAYGPALRALGCFWTVTPEVINKVGYLDVEHMGFRGIGHIDYTMRCCRAGFNDMHHCWDAKGSDDYIAMQLKSYEQSLPKEVVHHYRRMQRPKLRLAHTKNRIYVGYHAVHQPL